MIHPENNTLRVISDGSWQFKCPGCGYYHSIYPEGMSGNGPRWKIDSISPLTISPSLLVRSPSRVRVCHSFIKNGYIQFLGDCTHDLKGQTVPMIVSE